MWYLLYGSTSGENEWRPDFLALYVGWIEGEPAAGADFGMYFKFSEGGALKKISDAKDTPPLRKYEKVREEGVSLVISWDFYFTLER